jgi:hypothetical protein
VSTEWIERWDRFTCNDPSHPMHGQTIEVTARKMHGYLVSSVTGPCWTRMFIPAGDMPGPRWTPAPASTDMDEAVRLSVLNTIAENDDDDMDAGTPLSAIVDTIEQRSGKHPSLAYVTALLVGIGATERDGLWSVASLPAAAGWTWRPCVGGLALFRGWAWTALVYPGMGSDVRWSVHDGSRGLLAEGSEHTQGAAIERATWECRRRGLFAVPPERADRPPLPCDTMRRLT